MSHAIKSLFLWLVDELPDISNIVLGVLGVFLSFPTTAQRIEENTVLRRVIGGACILVSIAGFLASAHQRRSFNSQISQLVIDDDKLVKNTSDLAKNTSVLVGSTSTMVTNVGVLMTQVTLLGARLNEINVKIAAARESHDTHRVQELQAQATVTQKQADSAIKKLLVSTASNLANVLDRQSREWGADEDNRYLFYWERRQINAIDSDWQDEKKQIADNHRRLMRDAIVSANYLREQMVGMLANTDEDRNAAALFDRLLKEEFDRDEPGNAIGYLRKLSNRLAKE
jgi:hypothetical protein